MWTTRRSLNTFTAIHKLNYSPQKKFANHSELAHVRQGGKGFHSSHFKADRIPRNRRSRIKISPEVARNASLDTPFVPDITPCIIRTGRRDSSYRRAYPASGR